VVFSSRIKHSTDAAAAVCRRSASDLRFRVTALGDSNPGLFHSLDRFDTLDRERQDGNPVGVDELHVAHAQESESSLALNVRERSLELLVRSDEPPSML
jgi:hypothetical protein